MRKLWSSSLKLNMLFVFFKYHHPKRMHILLWCWQQILCSNFWLMVKNNIILTVHALYLAHLLHVYDNHRHCNVDDDIDDDNDNRQPLFNVTCTLASCYFIVTAKVPKVLAFSPFSVRISLHMRK